MSIGLKAHIVKMSILPRWMYSFNISPKRQQDFFVDTDKKLLKIYMERQRRTMAKTIFEKKQS